MLAVVKGAAIGVTNTKLARLIRAGVATAYPLQCYKQSDEVAADRLMVWKVTNIGIRQTAVISVAVIQRGNIVASVFKHVPAPGYNTDGMFMLDVSSLARKVLPPPATPMTSQPGNCS